MMKAKTKADQDRKGQLIIAVCVVVIAALLIAQAMLQSASGKVHPTTLCRTDRPLVGHTVVLIDISDAMQQEEVRQLKLRVEIIRARIAKGAMLSVFFINDESVDVLSERFCKCNPGDGSEANPLWSAPALIAKKWETAFGAPLDSAMKEASRYSESATSPILEAIRYVTEHDDFLHSTANRKLVIVSDMIQNTERFSQYGRTKSFEEFMNGEAAAELMPDLKDVEVQVEYLMRPRYKAVQNDGLKRFWQDYFARAGAKSPVAFRTIRGSYSAVVLGRGHLELGGNGEVSASDLNDAPGQALTLSAEETVPPNEEVPASPAELAEESQGETLAVDALPAGNLSPVQRTVPNAGETPSFQSESPAAPQTQTSPSTPETSSQSINDAYTDVAPKVITQTRPIYPEEARAAGVHGTVLLRALVGLDGHVKDVAIMKSCGILDAPAVAAVRQWTFTPGRVSGNPLAVWLMIPVTFVRTR